MEQLLAKKLYEFILRNNPDLLIREKEYGLNEIIRERIKNVLPVLENLLAQNCPPFIIEELCMDQMTEDLKPSRYHYIAHILEEEFSDRYSNMREAGVLTYEIANILDRCEPIFSHFQFSALTEEDRQLYHAVTGVIGEYFAENLNPLFGGL